MSIGRYTWIVEGVTFEDLDNNQIHPVDLHEKQIRKWYLSPARSLAGDGPRSGNYEVGIAVLALLLMFFEPHGKYKTGITRGKQQWERTQSEGKDGSKTPSKANSAGALFVAGFSPFLEFLVEQQLVERGLNLAAESAGGSVSAKVWMLARCGLMHDAQLKVGLLIDVRSGGQLVFKRNPMRGEHLLVDPWAMLSALERYVTAYVASLRSASGNTSSSQALDNFNSAFECLVRGPMRAYCSDTGAA